MDKIKRLKELIGILNESSNAYYNSTPNMTDYEWDKLYEELKALEEETKIIYPDSPTQNVGYKVLDEIKEVKHNHPMLSLDKCHTEQELIDFAKDKNCILSVKADGLTTSLHYIDGQLIGAETRGNGVSGSDVLENVLNIKNVPHTIPYKDELIIDGETIIDWNTFNKINENLPAGQDKYKHPRNLVSGTITMLDTNIAASRNMRFIAWRVIKGLNEKSVFLGLKEAEKLARMNEQEKYAYELEQREKAIAEKQLQDLSDQYKAELKMLQDEFNRKYSDFQAMNLDNKTAGTIKERRMQELQENNDKIELFMKNTSEDLRNKEAELLDPIRKRIDDAIKIIGEEQGFMLIYDVNEPGVAFLGPQFEDITSLVKLQLGL